jgi:hypothetical protein
MNNQKTFTLRSLLLLLALLLPILYFGYIIAYSSQNSGFVPKYNFLYVTDKSDSSCTGPNTQYDYANNQQVTTAFKKIIVKDNLVTVIESKDSNAWDYRTKFCSDEFYFHDISTNSSRLVNIESLANYPLVSNELQIDLSKKDPDNFEFKDNLNYSGFNPIFIERTNYDKPTYALTKQFSNKVLNLQGGRIRFLGFINK